MEARQLLTWRRTMVFNSGFHKWCGIWLLFNSPIINVSTSSSATPRVFIVISSHRRLFQDLIKSLYVTTTYIWIENKSIRYEYRIIARQIGSRSVLISSARLTSVVLRPKVQREEPRSWLYHKTDQSLLVDAFQKKSYLARVL